MEKKLGDAYVAQFAVDKIAKSNNKKPNSNDQMNTLMRWLHGHPLKAVLFTVAFTAIATAAGFREDLHVILGFIFIAMVLAWVGVFTNDRRNDQFGIGPRLMAMLLAGLFSYNSVRAAEPAQPPPQENVAAVGVGVVVICVGSYCLYKIVKICQKKFPPKQTNSEPSELMLTAASSDEYGASWDYSSIGSCWDGDANQLVPGDAAPDEPYVATLRGKVDEFGNVTTKISVVQDHDGQQSLTWAQFQEDLASHGLSLSGRGDGGKHYSFNGYPCGPELVPLSFDEQTHSIVHAGFVGQLRTITVERSRDFQTWTRFMQITTPHGTGFQVMDLTRQGQMFYRLNVQ